MRTTAELRLLSWSTTAETDAVCSFTRSRFYQSFGVIASLLEGEGLVASKLSSSLF